MVPRENFFGKSPKSEIVRRFALGALHLTNTDINFYQILSVKMTAHC